MRLTLLLNLAILCVTFFVALGASDSQARVLRTTARIAHAQPVVPARRPKPLRVVARPPFRLVRYLARLDGLERLTPRQVEALYVARDRCTQALARGEAEVRALNGARARAVLDELTTRVRSDIERTLRAAEVPPGATLAQLVRVVLASSG